MEEDSTTSVDDPSAAADTSTTSTDPTGTGQGTGDDANDSDPSKPADTDAGGDKTPPTGSADADTPAPLDADLDDWIEKKGLAPATTDEQKQAYQAMRNDQREFTRSRQADQASKDSKALGDSVKDAKDKIKPAEDDDTLDPLEKRQNKFEADLAEERNTRLQSEFYTTQKVTPEEHKLILDIFKEKVDSQPTDEGKLRAVDIWGSPSALPDLLDIARARITKSADPSAVETEAARKERERIAKESNAKSPGRSASTTTTSDKTEDEARLGRFKDRFNNKK